MFVVTVRDDGVCRLVELLVCLLGLCSIDMVMKPVNNHPPSVGFARMIDWDSRIT